MTHLRLWRFEVPADRGSTFLDAYKSDGDWARLFATAPGYLRTELWRGADGSYMTADHWESLEAFERFQANQSDEYRKLDAELEGIASTESFIGAFDLA
jgi:heme-degrading monooxygenase HmoA